MTDQVADIRFNALRNALYHEARSCWLNFLDRLFNCLVILGGTATVSDIFGKSVPFTWFALGITVIGTLQLVFNYAIRAAEHNFLRSRYYDLLAAVEENTSPEDCDVAHWNGILAKICADEPPQLRALDAICYNRACDALGLGHHIGNLKPWHSLLRHILPFSATHFKSMKRHITPQQTA